MGGGEGNAPCGLRGASRSASESGSPTGPALSVELLLIMQALECMLGGDAAQAPSDGV